MNIKYENDTMKMFGEILEENVGKKLACNDGSGMDDFILRKKSIPSMAKNLATWYSEEYGDEDVELTEKNAREYINRTYPIK